MELTPRSGQEALDALAQVSERLHVLGDPRAAFPELYGVITRNVLAETRAPRTRFLEPDWIDRLMGRFCTRYLDTLDRSLRGLPQDCGAWRLAYHHATAELAIPLRDVLFGISAHINHDLALCVSQTIAEHGHAGDPGMLARYKHDHDLVNELLRASIPESVARLRDRYRCHATGLAWWASASLVERVSMAALGEWREHVWRDVLRLLAASDATARAAALCAVERRSERIGEAIAGLSAGRLIGRAVRPRRLWLALRDLVVLVVHPARAHSRTERFFAPPGSAGGGRSPSAIAVATRRALGRFASAASTLAIRSS